MYQVDDPTAASTLPTPSALGTVGYYTDGNPGTGTPATIVRADHLNAMMIELLNMVTAGGITPSKAQQNQVIKALRRLFAGNVTTISAVGPTALTVDNAGLVNLSANANNVAVTLPAAAVIAGFPLYYDFVRTDTTPGNTVTITPNAGDTIDGQSSITLAVGSFRAIIADGVGIWRTVSNGFATTPVGQCRLTLSGANLLLSPYQGNKIAFPNGSVVSLPSTGLTLAPTGLAASTLYYIYLTTAAGGTLEASPTGHSTDANSGIEIKTGDAARVLVGMAYCPSAATFADTAAQRLVASWFNRRTRDGLVPLTSTASTSSTTFVELSTTLRAQFVTWGDEAVFAAFGGNVATAASFNSQTSLAFDGITAEDCQGFGQVTSNTSQYVQVNRTLTEGFHYATALGMSVSGTATHSWTGSGTPGTRCTMKTMTRA